jgi:hypothetical protein
MSRTSDTSIDSLRSLSERVDTAGYQSMLLVYHSTIADHFIKASNVINKEHSFKYMIALRTYALSPEYCAMMCRAFEEIDSNRLMLNVSSGDLHSSEKVLENIVYISDLIDTPKKRRAYTQEWLDKFTSIYQDGSIPEIVMAGHHHETQQMAKDRGYGSIFMLDMFLKSFNKPEFIKNEKQFVSLGVLVREELEDARNEFFRIPENEQEWTFYGTPEIVKQKLKDLKFYGITDILICNPKDDPCEGYIHEIVKEIIKEQKNGIE